MGWHGGQQCQMPEVMDVAYMHHTIGIVKIGLHRSSRLVAADCNLVLAATALS